MSLLIIVAIIVVVAALLIYATNEFVAEQPLAKIIKLCIIFVAVLVILQKSGLIGG